MAVSCQSMKDLGANLAEYNRLVTQPEYLEQRWKEVVAEWKAAVEEQNLGLPEAKELLHQKLKENQLLSLSRDHEYGNEDAEHREWALYVGFRHRSLLEQWYRTLPEKLDIPAEKLDQTMATFLDGQSIDRRIYMTFEQRKAWDGAMGELQDALLEYFQANGIVLTQSEAKRIALLHLEYEQKAKEERRLAEQKAAKEKRLAEQKAAEEKRLAERKAAEEKRLAEEKAAEEKRLAEEREKDRLANDPEYQEQRWKETVTEWRKQLEKQVEEKGDDWLKEVSFFDLSIKMQEIFMPKTNADYESRKKQALKEYDLALAEFSQPLLDKWWLEVEAKNLSNDSARYSLKYEFFKGLNSNDFSRAIEPVAKARLTRRAQERQARLMSALEPQCEKYILPLRQPWKNPVPLYKNLASGTTRENVLEWIKENGISEQVDTWGGEIFRGFEGKKFDFYIGKTRVSFDGIFGKTNDASIKFCFAVDPFGKTSKEKAMLAAVVIDFSSTSKVTSKLLVEKYSATHRRDAVASQEGHAESWINVSHSNSTEKIPEVYVNDQTTVIIETCKTYDHDGFRKQMAGLPSLTLYIVDTRFFKLCHELQTALEKGEEERAKQEILDF